MNGKQRPRFLVVDDDPAVCEASRRILQRMGCEVVVAYSGPEALTLLERESFDVVFTDLKMPEMSGVELLAHLDRRFPGVVPVVITGYTSIASAVETIKLGAFDYLPKPFTPDEMSSVALKALEKGRRRAREAEEPQPEGQCGRMLGVSKPMQEVFRLVRKVAQTDSTVLVLGEEGTGKELAARTIHEMSARRAGPFLSVTCSRPSPEMLEAELLGRAASGRGKGDGPTRGLFESAHGGTAFMDEICDLGLDLQGKLLDFLHGHQFEPEGSGVPRLADVRLIIASRRDLVKMVEEGFLRKDLYYRLYVFPISIPAIRDRPADIPVLARSFLAEIVARGERAPSRFGEESLRLMDRFSWPGNVRQIRDAVEWAAAACAGDLIEPRHLPPFLSGRVVPESLKVPRTNREFVEVKRRLRELAVGDLEREFVLQALERNNDSIARAAEDVGMLRQNFQALVRKHGIQGK